MRYRTCKYSYYIDINHQYEFDITEVQSLDEVLISAMSYISTVAPEYADINWHIHDTTFQEICDNPHKTIWICGHR